MALALRTLTLVNLVISGQAVYYVVRERRRIWSSRPSATVLLCSVADLLIVPSLALTGSLMAPLSLSTILDVAGAGVLFALVLDEVKMRVFAALGMRRGACSARAPAFDAIEG